VFALTPRTAPLSLIDYESGETGTIREPRGDAEGVAGASCKSIMPEFVRRGEGGGPREAKKDYFLMGSGESTAVPGDERVVAIVERREGVRREAADVRFRPSTPRKQYPK
jgi:hypothetical protein